MIASPLGSLASQDESIKFQTATIIITKQFAVDIDHHNNNFPFHSLADNICEFDIENFTQNLSQSGTDRLNQLKFNPFQQNQNIGIVQSGNNTELDTFCNTIEIRCDFL